MEELFDNFENYHYEYLNDKEREKKIKDWIDISFYSKQKSPYSNKTVPYYAFGELLKQDAPKESRRCMCINPLYNTSRNDYYNSRKRLKNLYYPFLVMLDIDCKKGKDKLFLSDIGLSDSTLEEGISSLIKKLHNDSRCVYTDISRSDKGIKAIFTVYSTQLLCIAEYHHKNNLKCDVATLRFLHQQNAKCILAYIREKYNLKLYKGKENYIDRGAMFNAVQPNFSSNGKAYHFNPDNEIIKFQIPQDEIDYFENGKKKKNILFNGGKTVELTVNRLNDINNSFCERFKKFYLQNADICDSFIHDEIFGHYDSPKHLRTLYSLKYVNDENRRFFYGLFVKNVSSDSNMKERFPTYESWVNYVASLTEKDNLTQVLLNIFKPIVSFNTVFDFTEDSDFFNRKYDEILMFKDYISTKYDEIKIILENNKVIVLKADANTGKTTVIFKYLIEKINENPNGIYVFISPKNSLLQQQLCKLKAEYPDINFIENYDKKTVRIEKISPKTIILSSSVKGLMLDNIDILVIDEIHNLVNFSEKIVSERADAKKTLLVSATPELYTLGQENFFYLQLKNENQFKKHVDVIYPHKMDETLQQFIKKYKDKKVLIYYQNINKHYEYFNFCKELGIELQSLSSKNKTAHYDEVLNTQKLYNNFYITTSTIMDGINFLNEEWDELIIITRNETVFDLYQLTNRFRQAKDLHITILPYKKKELYAGLISFNKLEDGYKEQHKKLIRVSDHFNNKLNKCTSTELVELRGIPNINGQYIANEDYVKLSKFREVIQYKFQNYENVFEEALGYYFDVNVLKEVKDDNSKYTPVISSDNLLQAWNIAGKPYIKVRYFQPELPEPDDIFYSTISNLDENDIQILMENYKVINQNKGYFNQKFNQYVKADKLISSTNVNVTDNNPFNYTIGSDNHYKAKLTVLENEILMNSDENKLNPLEQQFKKLRLKVDDWLVTIIKSIGNDKVELKVLDKTIKSSYYNEYRVFYKQYMKFNKDIFRLNTEGRSLSTFLRKNDKYFEIKRIGKDKITTVLIKP